MFSRCSQDLQDLPGCFQDAPMGIVGWWNLMIISNESMHFNDPKDFDDPQLFDDQLEVWTLIIQKSTVIPASPMVLFYLPFHLFIFAD